MINPAFSLNFTSATLDPSVTFTRANNTATRVNSSGLIEIVNADTARFDFNPLTLACRGLLVEEARTNAFTYSEQLQNVIYTKQAVSVTSNDAVSPDGTTTADKIDEGSAAGVHLISQPFSSTSGVTYTLSAFLKKGTSNFAQLLFQGTTFGTNAYANFNLNTGAIGTVGSATAATITDFGNGWFRCAASAPATSTSASATGIIGMITSSTAVRAQNYTGTNRTIFAWGVQVETGNFATSYIPTTATALTRNADVATITGTNFSDWWQASLGGVVVNARPGTVSGTRPWVQFDDGTANEIIALRGNTTNPELYIVDDGSPQAQIDAGTIAANIDYSLTGWWQTNNCAARLNLAAPVFDTSATIPTVTQMRIGSDGTNYINGHLASISYYDRLTSYIYTRRKNKVVFSVI